MRALTILPVYNEAQHVEAVLGEVRRYVDDVLVVHVMQVIDCAVVGFGE